MKSNQNSSLKSLDFGLHRNAWHRVSHWKMIFVNWNIGATCHYHGASLENDKYHLNWLRDAVLHQESWPIHRVQQWCYFQGQSLGGSCSCRKYDLVKILCEHEMAIFRAKYGDGEAYGNFIYEYSSPIDKVKTYLFTYSKAINVVPL
ncbi:hypothetical protein FXO38_29074 [Capsicum annuum]|nr:hypothetical protein FXO38_29074 [Capsicum annuum]KAF3652079.1 hypothetical protein FXO37_17677 [Capsicum annuum]